GPRRPWGSAPAECGGADGPGRSVVFWRRRCPVAEGLRPGSLYRIHGRPADRRDAGGRHAATCHAGRAMRIVKLKPEHVRSIDLQDAQQYFAGIVDTPGYAESLAASPWSFAAVDGDEVLVCAGV